VDSKLAVDLQREIPMGMINSTGAVHNLATLATRSGPLAEAASAAVALITRGGSAATQGAQTFDSFGMLISKDIHGIFQGADRSLEKVLVPDGLYPDKTPLEIKGPGDGPNPIGQPENYAKASLNKQCKLACPEACDYTTAPDGGCLNPK
jgi:hypothetical protein